MASIKAEAESSVDLKSFPSTRLNFDPTSSFSELQDPIPVVDYSLLTSGNPDEQSKAIQDLGKACQEWGFFMVINHGIPATLVNQVLDAANEFFGLPEEEKPKFEGKNAFAPISCGINLNAAKEDNKASIWREYVRVTVLPEFQFPNKPAGFREIAFDYCKGTRKVARDLLNGISKSLHLEESYMEEILKLESGLHQFTVNLYPPCPQTESATGLPPHTDPGVLTLLCTNGVPGYQIFHNGKWVPVHEFPNAFLADVGDLLQIFSNGKYKASLHRANVNEKLMRMSLVSHIYTSSDTIVGPCPKLVDADSPPLYLPTEFKEYIRSKKNVKTRKGALDQVRVMNVV